MNSLKNAFILYLFSFLFTACSKEHGRQTPGPDPVEEQWTGFDPSNSGMPDHQVNCIAISRDNIKWIGTSKGLARYNGNEWQVFNSNNSPLTEDYIQALAVENSGAVWVGTSKGLARYDGNQWQVFSSSNSPLTEEGITSLAYDPQRNTLYIGTEACIRSLRNGSEWSLLEESGNVTLSLAVDRQGVLWAGIFNYFAFAGRVVRWENGDRQNFNLSALGYPSGFPYSIAIDDGNTPLISLSGTSVSAVVKVKGTILEEVTRPEGVRGIRALCAGNGKIWAAGQQLSVIGAAGNPVYQIPGTGAPVYCLAIDPAGNKWLGTLYDGLIRYADQP